jgi:hypothetical protein
MPPGYLNLYFFDTGAAHSVFGGRNIIAATLINDKALDGGS